jgi:hypothetical protein
MPARVRVQPPRYARQSEDPDPRANDLLVGDEAELGLPAVISDKLNRLKRQRDQDRALFQIADAERSAARDRLQDAEGRLRFLKQPSARLVEHHSEGSYAVGRQSFPQPEGMPDDAPAVIAVRKEIARYEKKLAEADQLATSRSARFTALSQLVTACEKFLQDLGNAPIVLHQPQPVTKKKNGSGTNSFAEGVEALRARLRTLAQERRAVAAAPYPSSLAKTRLRELIDELASKGSPQNLLHVIEANDASRVAAPTIRTQHSPHVGVQTSTGWASGVASIVLDMPDPLSLLCWLNRDAVLKRINSEIDKLGDDERALSVEQRQAKLLEIDELALSAEREEEALITLAEQQGVTAIDRRSDATPKVVLGIA